MRCQLGTESHYENITKRDSMVSIIIIVDCKGFFLLLHSKCIEIQIHLFMYFFDAVSLAINLLPWAITASVSAVLSLPKLIHDQKVKARWDGNYCLQGALYIPSLFTFRFIIIDMIPQSVESTTKSTPRGCTVPSKPAKVRVQSIDEDYWLVIQWCLVKKEPEIWIL